MTVFEKVTASPETLGEFLASLPIVKGPWDKRFLKEFCAFCEQKKCDVKTCPHKDVRNKPVWWLTQATEDEQDASRAVWTWSNGRVELEQGTVVLLKDQEGHTAGTCNDFNVYLNGKGPDGKILHNIKRMIMPTISVCENGKKKSMNMELAFGGCEDVAKIVALLGKMCKIEVRAAVKKRNQDGQIEFCGFSYSLEAVPLEIRTDTVKMQAGIVLEIGFRVYRYTATVGDTQLWDFEWTKQGWKRRE